MGWRGGGRLVTGRAVWRVGRAAAGPPPEPPHPPGLSASRVGSIERPRKPRHATNLVPCSALPDLSLTEVIGPEGGYISVGPHLLVIPAGALKRRVAITANLHFQPRGHIGKAGLQVNAVRFQPKLKF